MRGRDGLGTGVDIPAAGGRIPAGAVRRAIRDDIVSGVYPFGSRLTEEQLARRYGVSRVPVREALRALESEGFVTTRRHAGACVAEPTDDEAADLLEVRALLEPLVAARAARRRTEAHVKVLRGLVTLGRKRADRGLPPDLRSLDTWFHETLAQAAGSPTLVALLTQVRRKIAWVYADPRPPATADLWSERGAIVDAVARGDAGRARGLMAAHLDLVEPDGHRLRRGPAVRNPKQSVNRESARN
ncbi:GntR family transcriptional regulator [Streptomyces zingiberis]|uniref:GntR family transcriptional regulator n=1 Tax=Streptomyces zingiberis TaxID=2053010 RepID=A0ABX1BWD8_9ACTN|nr:GntR family transcriptional regulator [Streptomyces zingiberis]NJQ01971.1 GntR family transcriptional regulator [Streptomyces zingiberis]